ncbi:MAG: hypothetical protein ACREL5_09825 [Gemmatimonadales bacterium]
MITSVVHDTMIYDWGSLSRSITIPPTSGGNPADSAGYTMTLIGYTRDNPFHRQNTADSAISTFYVCHITSGQELRLGAPSSQQISPRLPAGC